MYRMINANRTHIKIVLATIALLAGIYFSIQSFNSIQQKRKSFTIPFQQESYQQGQAQMFHYGSPVYNYTNPTELKYPHDRFKAAFITFVKNDVASLTKLRFTIRNIEDTFNQHHHYPYIIFSDQDLSLEYMELASSLTSSNTTVLFEKVDKELYGYNSNTDLDRAAEARIEYNNSMFGDSEDYRFQSRFMAGTVYRHPLMQDLDYSWRFEAGTEYVCPLAEDPFEFMYREKKTTSFSVALYEYKETIPTLFSTVLEYAKDHPSWTQPSGNPRSLWHFILDEDKNFNGCHFWNNFQISDVRFYKGERYQSFFSYLDNANGIFYERWGDPVIQSLGAVMFLTKDDVHFWDNIGYRVANYFTHCPTEQSLYSKCTCRPIENFDDNGYSCLRFY